MPVVEIRIVGVLVHHRRVAVPMSMGFAGRTVSPVFVVVMRIMDVAMLVFQQLVRMLVIV